MQSSEDPRTPPMNYKILAEGFVYECPQEGPDEIAVTSRCAVTQEGDVLCSFMTESGLGRNDFTPCLAVSHDAAG